VPKWLMLMWAIVIIFCLFALIWFMLGTTANFQRDIDLITTFLWVTVWTPTLLILVATLFILSKGRNPIWIVHVLWMVLIIILSVVLFRNVNTSGWLTENISRDSLKVTEDMKYEYRIELINIFQKNSHTRLYVKEVETEEEKTIPIDFPTNQIHVLYFEQDKQINWVYLKPATAPDSYILRTTEELRIPELKYEINIAEGSSKKIE